VAELKAKGISVKFDDSDNKKPGWKFAEYELKGVPVRLAMGPRDLENGTVEVARRDTLEKNVISLEGIAGYIENLLEDIQQGIFNKALDFRTQKTTKVETWEEFKEVIQNKGGFVSAHWDGTAETEDKIKNETKATIRCIPLENEPEEGKCIYSGKPSKQRVLLHWLISFRKKYLL
jgi:prolyl-tRNA synthetase